MARILGVDFGSRRVGLAVSDPSGRIASPLTTLEVPKNPSALLQLVLREARAWEAGEIVLGLPLNMDGSEGPQARRTREFGAALARAGDIPVRYWDERLSSHAAKDSLDQTGMSRDWKRSRIDTVAAAVILQSCLDALASSNNADEPPAEPAD